MNLLVLVQSLISIALATPTPPGDSPRLDPIVCQNLFLDEVKAIGEGFLPWNFLRDAMQAYDSLDLIVRIDIRGNVTIPMAHLGLRPDAFDMPANFSAIHDGAAYAVIRGYVPSILAAAEELTRRYEAARLSFQVAGSSAPFDLVHLPLPTETVAAHSPDARTRANETRDVMLVDYATGTFAISTQGLEKFSRDAVSQLQVTWLPEDTTVAELLKNNEALHAVKLENSTLLTLAAHRHLKRFESRPFDARLEQELPEIPDLAVELEAHVMDFLNLVNPNSAWSIGTFLRRVTPNTNVNETKLVDLVFRAWTTLAPQVGPLQIWRQIAETLGPNVGLLSEVETGTDEDKARLIAVWKLMVEDIRFKIAHPDTPDFDRSEPSNDGLSILWHLHGQFPGVTDPQILFNKLYDAEFGERSPNHQFDPNTGRDALWRPESASQSALANAWEEYKAKKSAKVGPTVMDVTDPNWIEALGSNPSNHVIMNTLSTYFGRSMKRSGMLLKSFDELWAKYLPQATSADRSGVEPLRPSDGKHGYYEDGLAAQRIVKHWRQFYEAYMANKMVEPTVTEPASAATGVDGENPLAWIESLGATPHRDDLIEALVKHVGMTKSSWSLEKSFNRLWTRAMPDEPLPKLDILQTDSASIMYGARPTSDGRLMTAWTTFWEAFVKAKTPVAPVVETFEPESSVDEYDEARATLGQVTIPEFKDLTPPDQIKTTGDLKQVLSSLGRVFRIGRNGAGMRASGSVRKLFFHLYVHYYPTSSKRSLTSMMEFSGLREREYNELDSSSPVTTDIPSFNLYTSYYSARKLREMRGATGVSFETLPAPTLITNSHELRDVLRTLNAQFRTGKLTGSHGFDRLFEALFAKAYPQKSAVEVRDLVSQFKFRSAEYDAVKRLQDVGPGERSYDAYQALYEAVHAPQAERGSPAGENPVAKMIEEMATVFGTTPEALMAQADNHAVEWYAIDETKPIFSMTVSLLRSLLEDPHSEAAEKIARNWEKDKESIQADRKNRDRIAISLTNLEPYQVREIATVLSASYDVSQTKTTLKELWSKFLPASAEPALSDLFARLKIQNEDLAEAARADRVPPAVFRRLRQVWTVFVAEVRKDQQMIAPPALELPDPNEVTDAYALVETLARNISFAIPRSNEAIIDVFKALFLNLRLGPQDNNFDALIRARVAPEDLARLNVEPRGPAFRRVVGLYRIYFERITGNVEASATGQNKVPRDLSLPIETSQLGTLVQKEMRGVLESYPTNISWSADNGIQRNFGLLLGAFQTHPRFELAMEELSAIPFQSNDYYLITNHERAALSRLRKAWRVLQLLVEPKELRTPIDVAAVKRMRRQLDIVFRPVTVNP